MKLKNTERNLSENSKKASFKTRLKHKGKTVVGTMRDMIYAAIVKRLLVIVILSVTSYLADPAGLEELVKFI